VHWSDCDCIRELYIKSLFDGADRNFYNYVSYLRPGG
jgi:hypothetical protein